MHSTHSIIITLVLTASTLSLANSTKMNNRYNDPNNTSENTFKIQAFSLLTVVLENGIVVKRLPGGGASITDSAQEETAPYVLRYKDYTFGGSQTDGEFLAEIARFGTITKIIHPPQ